MSTKSISDIIGIKRDGGKLSYEDLELWIKKLLNGDISDAQLAAWLMAVYIRGLDADETANLTMIMTTSGDVLSWPKAWANILVDKHSTGGVGDKVSLVLAPALAACGRKVPMISGRGLGITGGTLDKLESIPGYNVTLSAGEILSGLEKVGCVIAGQTGTIAPADKIIYACRDHTNTVGNLSLQTSSILSKKAAENIGTLVMDVKYGKGCYQPTLEYAEKVANSLVTVSHKLGIKTTAVISMMDDPLGKLIGNALEVAESIQCLRGEGPFDLEELVIKQGGLLLSQSGDENYSVEEGEDKIRDSIKNGSALKKFEEMIIFQGVAKNDANILCNDDMWSVLKKSQFQTILTTPIGGSIEHIDALKIGRACVDLGAGRSGNESKIDTSVGIELIKSVGDELLVGDPWIKIYHKQPVLEDEIVNQLKSALAMSEKKLARNASKIIKIVK